MKTLRQITRLILRSRPKRNETAPAPPLDAGTERKRKISTANLPLLPLSYLHARGTVDNPATSADQSCEDSNLLRARDVTRPVSAPRKTERPARLLVRNFLWLWIPSKKLVALAYLLFSSYKKKGKKKKNPISTTRGYSRNIRSSIPHAV